jgi:hypothetical protein
MIYSTSTFLQWYWSLNSNCSKIPVLRSDILCFLRFYTPFVWFWPKVHKDNVSKILHYFYGSPQKNKKLEFYCTAQNGGILIYSTLLCVHNHTVTWSLRALTHFVGSRCCYGDSWKSENSFQKISISKYLPTKCKNESIILWKEGWGGNYFEPFLFHSCSLVHKAARVWNRSLQ